MHYAGVKFSIRVSGREMIQTAKQLDSLFLGIP